MTGGKIKKSNVLFILARVIKLAIYRVDNEERGEKDLLKSVVDRRLPDFCLEVSWEPRRYSIHQPGPSEGATRLLILPPLAKNFLRPCIFRRQYHNILRPLYLKRLPC
uniref:Uncharacterized protein n=1 Tax=Populus trichocarpa TaxID=3694 RepID=A0A2K1R525_POPTR